MLKARLAVAEAVGAGDCQAGDGSRRVLGARGRATSPLAAAAHGLRLALPGAFPSTTPPRLFDQPSYPLKTPRSRARRSRTSASPRSRPQRSRRWSTATRGQAVVSGETWACGQHEDDACGQHDEGREMGDHGFVSTKQKPAAAGRTWRLLALRRYPAQGVSPFASTWRRNSPKVTSSLASEGHSCVFAGQTRQPYGNRCPNTALQRSWMQGGVRAGCRERDPQPARVAATTAAPASDFPYCGLEPKTE